MALYRVLVAHNGLKVNQAVTLEDGSKFVRAGYLVEVEGVRNEPSPVVHVGDLEPARPRRGRRPKPEVTDVPDSPEPGPGAPDSAE